MFEKIIDVEQGADNLVVFLNGIGMSHGHSAARLLPFVANRIVRFFLLGNEVSQFIRPQHTAFITSLAFLPWHLKSEIFEKVVIDLIGFFAVVQWSVIEPVFNFVHSVCFAQIFVLAKRIARKICDKLLTQFMEHERRSAICANIADRVG
jgi:hypothetical protein